MDVRVTAFPQALFAALSIDTKAHFTQVVSETVSCPGDVLIEFPLKGSYPCWSDKRCIEAEIQSSSLFLFSIVCSAHNNPVIFVCHVCVVMRCCLPNRA